MSWNAGNDITIPSHNRSASLWGCELKWYVKNYEEARKPSASLWGCELKYSVKWKNFTVALSASLWGCELKFYEKRKLTDWLSSASLWGCELKYASVSWKVVHPRQPPCEAVSWNTWNMCRRVSQEVSLLVRLWVEIFSRFWMALLILSASLWGCELKYNSSTPSSHRLRQPPCEAVSWNERMKADTKEEKRSASLWGCELKLVGQLQEIIVGRQPPCEAVSWNDLRRCEYHFRVVSLLVRLWVEIKYTAQHKHMISVSLLVRLWVEIFRVFSMVLLIPSASLWGCELKYSEFPRWFSWFRSASLWGCELKYQTDPGVLKELHVSLLVRLWVEMEWMVPWWKFAGSASLWGCELKLSCAEWLTRKTESASLWGCELKYVLLNSCVLLCKSASLWGCELKWF